MAFYLARQWSNLLRQILILLFILKGIQSDNCRVDNIKNGYRFKLGLDQDNIKPLGVLQSLESCSKLCCNSNQFQYGLYDGSKCYGIICTGNTDTRCTLRRDGNAKYTIFKIVRQRNKKSKRKKHKRQSKSKSHRHHKIVKEIGFTKSKWHHFNKTVKNIGSNTRRKFIHFNVHSTKNVSTSHTQLKQNIKKNNRHFHRKHNKRRRKHSSDRKKRDRSSKENVYSNLLYSQYYNPNFFSNPLSNPGRPYLDPRWNSPDSILDGSLPFRNSQVARSALYSTPAYISPMPNQKIYETTNFRTNIQNPNKNDINYNQVLQSKTLNNQNIYSTPAILQRSMTTTTQAYPNTLNRNINTGQTPWTTKTQAYANNIIPLSRTATQFYPNYINNFHDMKQDAVNLKDKKYQIPKQVENVINTINPITRANQSDSGVPSKSLVSPDQLMDDNEGDTRPGSRPSNLEKHLIKKQPPKYGAELEFPVIQKKSNQVFTDSAVSPEAFFKEISNDVKPQNANIQPQTLTNNQDESSKSTVLKPAQTNQNNITKETVSPNLFLTNDVKPLSDFPTDSTLKEHSSRDIIPKPEENNLNQDLVTSRDNVIDIPFSTNLQLPKSSEITEQGLFNYQQYLPSSAQDHASYIPLIPHSSTLMYPLTPKQQHTYKQQFLKSKQTSSSYNNSISNNGNFEIDESIPIAFQIPEFEKLELRNKTRDSVDQNDTRNLNATKTRNDLPKEPTTLSDLNIKKAIIQIDAIRQQIEGLLQDNETESRPTYGHHLEQHQNENKTEHTLDSSTQFKNETEDATKELGCINPIGITSPQMISNKQMIASSYTLGFPPENGRLRIKDNGEMESRSWCANENFLDRPQFLQINFGRDQLFCKIATQGNNANNKWVKRFKLLYSKNGRDWNTYRENGKDKAKYVEINGYVGNNASNSEYYVYHQI